VSDFLGTGITMIGYLSKSDRTWGVGRMLVQGATGIVFISSFFLYLLF